MLHGYHISRMLIPIVLLVFLQCYTAAQANNCDLKCVRGQCVLNPANNQTQCKCDPDYSGALCELYPCDSPFQQCQNNGKCFKDVRNGQYKCVCDENHQFTGALCEKSVCADYCHHDARCEVSFLTDTDGSKTAQPSCNCTDSRYAGQQCEFDRCESFRLSCPKNCFLTSSDCNCVCDKQCDDQYCNGNGKCVEKDDQLGCKCNAGYSGDTCFVDDCKGYCFFNGTCKRSEPPETGVYCECSNGSTEKRCAILVTSKAESSVPSKTRFQIIRVIIYGITIILLMCLLAICAYVAVQRGYADRLFRKNQPTSSEPASRTSRTERIGRFVPSFRFFKSGQSFNRLDDEQPITHYENANV